MPERELPEPVRRHLERALGGDRSAPGQVRIRQEGQMWQKPGGRAMRFTATEYLAVDRVAFSWRARFPVAGPIAMHAVDDYAEGDGRLEVRLLGLPVQRRAGAEISRGEALRYLAELPWVPHAIALNRELEWRALGDRAVEVATRFGDGRLVVSVEVDGEGDIVRSSSEMRRYEVDKRWTPTPWAGDFRDYKLLGGMRIPTRAEAHWDLPDGRFVYWRATVTSAEALDEPFPRG